MVWYRIMAMIWRHIYDYRHNIDKLADGFYWPAMDIIIWGLTSQFFMQSEDQTSPLILMILSAIIFWQVVWRSQYEMTVNALEEIWNRNFVNLFSSPLQIGEWIVSLMLIGIIKMFITVGFSILLILLLYQVSILQFGLLLVPFFALLLMTGWWIGMIVMGIIVYFGQSLQTFAWAGVYILAPFSAIYYPVNTLPAWAQTISHFVPTSYIFEGMREVILTGNMPWGKLIISLILNLFYLLISLFIFLRLFDISRRKGLARLE